MNLYQILINNQLVHEEYMAEDSQTAFDETSYGMQLGDVHSTILVGRAPE